jgi:hypothetical protein
VKTAKRFSLCIALSWVIGWFAMRAIDDSDRDMSFPPKPIPQAVELFLIFLPLTIAITVSGNVHQPSEVGVWVGLFVQWTTIGVVLYFIMRGVSLAIRKRRADEKKG